MINIVFVGNGNVGKTTWFNYLSNSYEKVANYVGVSVDVVKTSFVYQNKRIQMVDLPGLYDLYEASGEEVYAKEYILKEKVDVFVFVLDARNPYKSLHLFQQIKALKSPVVLLCNFMNENEEWLYDLYNKTNTPILCVQRKHKEILLDILINIGMFYQYVPSCMKTMETKGQTSKINTLDRIMLHPFLGIICMFFIIFTSMSLLFYIASYAMGMIEIFGNVLQSLLLQHSNSDVWEVIFFSSITLFSFLPFLILFYGFIALLEESGYMARIAYLLHPFLSKFHLSGNSVLPLLCGYSCSALAIMATRSVKDEKEKRRCAMLLPFLNCSGKLPLYVLFIHTFFKADTILMFLLLYGCSLLIVFLFAYLFSNKQKQECFVMELPAYQMPSFSIFIKKIKMEVIAFMKKGWKIIIFGSFMLGIVFPYIPMDLFGKIFSVVSFAESKDALYSLPFGLISKENLLVYFTSKVQHQSLSMYISSLWTGKERLIQAFTYLLYVSMSVPCVMTLSAIYSEFGLKFLIKSILLMLIVPFVVCICIDFGVDFLSLIL